MARMMRQLCLHWALCCLAWGETGRGGEDRWNGEGGGQEGG